MSFLFQTMTQDSNTSATKPVLATADNRLMVPTTTVALSHGERPEKFTGVDFKRWQQKMLFYLTTLNLAMFLTEDALTVDELEPDASKVEALNIWKNSDFISKNYILNGLDNSLYNVYCTVKTSKLL